MYNNLKLLAILFFTVFFSCKKDQPVIGEVLRNDTIVSTYIKVDGEDQKAVRYFNLMDYSHLFGEDTNFDQRNESTDSLFYTMDSITKPKIMQIMAFGDVYYNTRILVTPGDSVSITLSDGKINFSGKHSENYQFYYELDSTDSKYAHISYDGNIYDYKQKCKAIYESNLAFFSNYIQKHPNISEAFKTDVSAELKFEYFYNLINPRLKRDNSTYTINSMDGLITVISNNSKPMDGKLLDLQDYFENIKIVDFDRPELIHNDYFKRCLVDYIRQYFKKSDYLDYGLESFNAEKKFIDANLKGDIKKYAEARLISDYYNKGFGSDQMTALVLRNSIDDYRKQTLKPSYRNKMLEIEDNLDVSNLVVNENELTEKVATLSGKIIDLKSIFEKEKGTIKVFDIWASWCAPCIKDIKEASEFKTRLTSQKNVQWIHLSVDSDSKSWLDASSRLNASLPFEHQYRFVDFIHSDFLKSMKFLVNGKYSVPRYIIISEKDEVILNNAPRPSDSIVFKTIIDKIN